MPEIRHLSSGSSQQRDHLNHQAIEDYLKTIYSLEEEESPVSTSRIAEARNVKPGSATSMIQRLDKLKLVEYQKHYGVVLTPAGRKLALEVIRHHRLLELYLMEALGFGWDEVHEQADVLEHVISEKLEERIAAALHYPDYDPHGSPIPKKDGTVPEPRGLALLNGLNAGISVRIARILEDNNPEMLRYLSELGLTPGAIIHITEIAPFAGPLTLDINGATKIIGQNVASMLLVELI